MKKLIALFAVSALASTTAIAGVALSGSASVTYDDGGSGASSTSGAATLTVTGTAGGTTVAAGFSLEGANIQTDSVTMSTAIGPITVTADLFDEDDSTAIVPAVAVDDNAGGNRVEKAAVLDSASVDTSVSVSLAAPIGDATLSLDDSGDITVSGTWSGVTISHTIQAGADETTGSASIAGMDISITNDGGDSTWSIATTVSGVALTLNSANDISASFGLSGNTMTVTHTGEVAETAANWGTDASTSVAISRTLTSGATLAATYEDGGALTLKASVSF